MEYQDIKQHTVKKSWNIVILYVIQLSDRVYTVTFPAYDIYSLRRRQGI
jgi:hypothetical protein